MSVQAVDDTSGLLQRVSASDGSLRVANFVWDTDTLSWVRQSQGSSGGPTSNVNVLSTTGLTDTQLRASPITTIGATSASRVDDLGTTIYIGKAALGVATASPVWQIKRITFTGSQIITQWADGDANYNNTWDDRASYTYS